MATDEAIPGTSEAAKMYAGNIGPIPIPAHAKPILTMMRARMGCVSESGTPIAIPAPKPIPPK